MDYEFNAPLYLDFDNPDSQEVQCLEPVTIQNEEKSKPDLDEGMSKSIPNKENTSEPTQNKENASEATQNKENTPTTTLKPQNRSTQHDNYASQPIRQSPRLAAIAKSIRRSNASRGLLPAPRTSSGPSKAHRRSLSEGANIVSRFSRVEKTTIQRKVAVVRPEQHQKPGTSGLGKDDIANLDQNTQYQKILSINRQRNSVTKNSKGPLKSTSVKSIPLKPTKPMEFTFATDSRIKGKGDVNEEPSLDFQRTLRSQTTSNQEAPKGPTKVQPFNLHSSKPKEAKPFVSLAELNLKFQTKTPQRFRTKRYGSQETTQQEPLKKTRTNTGGVTQPKTPQLSTKARTRSVNYPTREERETQELEEAKKGQFKAQPLNKKILAEPIVNQSQETDKRITVPQPFDITDMKKPPKKLLEKTLLGSATSLSSIPHGGITNFWEKKSTGVKPFSFDSRDAEMIRKKKEKIKMMIEEEKKKAEFHAQPMPIFDGVKGLPAKKPPTPTKVQPFNLRSDVRGTARQEVLQRELEALEELEKEQRKFAAQPDTVLHKHPFVPQKSDKPLTDISGFSLNTEKRAEERQAFDIHLKQKEDELMAKKLEMEERKKLEEEQEVQKMRKNAVHKAQPVRHYKPIEIKQGLLLPTVAAAPNFLTERRIRTRAKSEQSGIATPDGTFSMDY